MDIPNDYKTAGILNLVGGGLTLLVSGLYFLSLIWVCVGVVYLVPMAMGAWQAYVGFNMNNGQPQGQAKTAAIVGIVSGVLTFNIIALIASVVAMMNVNKPEVAGWLEQQGV